MTHNIRKHAPEGAEYFAFNGSKLDYYRVGENNDVEVWHFGEWVHSRIVSLAMLHYNNRFHALYGAANAFTLLICVVAVVLTVIYCTMGR